MAEDIEIFFVVGEASGDQHAALVAEHLLQRPGVCLYGAGGPHMRAAGVEVEFASGNWGTVSIAQALPRIPPMWVAGLRIQRRLVQRPPDLLVLVDFGGFNVGLSRKLRRRLLPDLKILYYFPPGSWNPRPRDFSFLAPTVDAVATPFEYSARMLQQAGIPATWVGHPVLDRLAPVADREAFRRQHNLPAGEPVIGLLPGSRPPERRCLGPQFLRTVAWLHGRVPRARFLWSVLPGRRYSRLDHRAAHTPGVQVVEDSALLMQGADLVITAMGTATLEAAAADCLTVTAYRGSLGMWLQYRFMDLGTDLYALPNILLGERVIPELIHKEATPENLGRQVLRLWQDSDCQNEMRAALAQVRAKLGPPGASRRTAEIIYRLARGERAELAIKP